MRKREIRKETAYSSSVEGLLSMYANVGGGVEENMRSTKGIETAAAGRRCKMFLPLFVFWLILTPLDKSRSKDS